LIRTATTDIAIATMHHFPMRTTVSIDDEVLEQARRYAEERSLSVGEAVTELIRKAFRTPTPTKMVNGLCVFDLTSWWFCYGLPKRAIRLHRVHTRDLTGCPQDAEGWLGWEVGLSA